MKGERIRCAALEYQDRVFEGRSHFFALRNFLLKFPELEEDEDILDKAIDEMVEGFVTSRGRFVSRDEGMDIARAAGQVVPGIDGAELQSEHLRAA